MGLLFVMPVSEKETDRVSISDNGGSSSKITLKSYGLPLIFWGYCLGILVTLFIMYTAASKPLIKLGNNGDIYSLLIYYAVWLTFSAIPLVLVVALFYEKSLIKSDLSLSIKHKVMGIPLFWKNLTLKNKDSFIVEHYMDTPNVARKKQVEELRAFQNQGHFVLKAHLENDKFLLIDRHGRRADLKKIAALLSKY